MRHSIVTTIWSSGTQLNIGGKWSYNSFKEIGMVNIWMQELTSTQALSELT